MAVPDNLKNIFKYVDQHKDEYIELLKEAVAIKSVSAWAHTRGEVKEMVEWTKKKLEALGATCTLKDIGIQTLPDGTKLPLPPVLFGQLGTDSSKKTLCVYGHLDVQPALKEDGWDTEPFVLQEKDGKLYGRGSTDDKGPVIGWINAIEAYQNLNQEIPVNVKFVFEGMEESGSEGLDELLISEKDKFLAGTDFVCISDNYWLGKKKPCITYGLRGVCYYFVEVACSDKDLHSGVFGGTVHEAMADLVALLNTLVDVKGNILIKDLQKQVKEVTSEEKKLYDDIDFDVEEYRKDMGALKLTTETDKAKTLMQRWRFPSLSIHGIEGAFYEPGCKTVIPRKVIGKFSVRIVPDQTPEFVTKCVVDHLNNEWGKRGSPNTMKAYLLHSGMHWLCNPSHPNYMAGRRAIKLVYGVDPDLTREGCSIPVTITFQAYMYHGGQCWMSDPIHPNYEAGKRATQHVYGVSPDMTREGGSIPVTLTLQVIETEGSAPAWMSDPYHPNFEAGKRATHYVYGTSPDMTREGGSIPITITLQDVTGKNVMLLPMGASDDGAHSQNEKIDVRNYIEGTKLLAAYLYEVSKA